MRAYELFVFWPEMRFGCDDSLSLFTAGDHNKMNTMNDICVRQNLVNVPAVFVSASRSSALYIFLCAIDFRDGRSRFFHRGIVI